MHGVELVTPRLARVTLGGDELADLVIEQPAASVRLLLPEPGSDVVVPEWNGNEFLLSDGRRPTIRTFTPWRMDNDALELELGIVLHGTGAASEWARNASAGDPAAVSGPGRGYAIDEGAARFVLGGDETAIPAITQLLAALPRDAGVEVHVEIAAPEARFELGGHPGAIVSWHELDAQGSPGDALAAALEQADIDAECRVWVAGEAAAVQRIRKHLFNERDVPRAHATVRGYWKHGRSADTETED